MTQPAQGTPARQDVDVLIVGSGFAGLGAAIRLAREGRTDYLVLERGEEVGGTWRDNTYPGAACDVPSHLYSYSYELNPSWSRSFSPQAEIQHYLRTVAAKYGVLERHRFGTEVTLARWDGRHWLVDTTNGAFRARVLVPAVGALCEPALPDIPGLDGFAGEVFHSARWNHAATLDGKRVALVGTGASAIQIGPAIVDRVASLDVYQRTAPWVMPRRDRAYSAPEQLAYRHVPLLQRAARELIYWGRETFVLGFAYWPAILRVAQGAAERNIARGIRDPRLRRRVTPDWQLGCKRVLISNDWYPMLARDDVELVTDPIVQVRPDAIVTATGEVREVDAIVLATGFHVTDSPTYDRIVGADGRSLGAVWQAQGAQAYKGTAVAGFPNLFLLIGPNTGLGHNSMVLMIESQLNYLASALREMDRRGLATVEVRPSAQRAYNAALQRRMRRTIWTTGGCSSWYLDEHGNNTTLWPGFTFTFRQLTRRFDLDAYVATPTCASETSPVPAPLSGAKSAEWRDIPHHSAQNAPLNRVGGGSGAQP